MKQSESADPKQMVTADTVPPPSSLASLVATDGRWCLVRWMSGETAKTLLARGGRDRQVVIESGSFDEERELSFCGPLAISEFPGGRIGMGFPRGRIGKIKLFDTHEAAAEWVEQKGDHISIDVPTPVDCLHFSCVEHSHWDGSNKVLYGDGDIRWAFAAYFIRRGMLAEDEDRYAEIEVKCLPRLDRIGEHRPTSEQAARMNANARAIDQRLARDRAAESGSAHPEESERAP